MTVPLSRQEASQPCLASIPGASVHLSVGPRGHTQEKGQKRQPMWQQKAQSQLNPQKARRCWSLTWTSQPVIRQQHYVPPLAQHCMQQVFSATRGAWFQSSVDTKHLTAREIKPIFISQNSLLILLQSPFMSQYTKCINKTRKEIFYSWAQSPADFGESLLLLLRCLISRHRAVQYISWKVSEVPSLIN